MPGNLLRVVHVPNLGPVLDAIGVDVDFHFLLILPVVPCFQAAVVAFLHTEQLEGIKVFAALLF